MTCGSWGKCDTWLLILCEARSERKTCLKSGAVSSDAGSTSAVASNVLPGSFAIADRKVSKVSGELMRHVNDPYLRRSARLASIVLVRVGARQSWLFAGLGSVAPQASL